MGEAKYIYFTCLNYFNLTFPVAATRTMSAWRAAGVTYVRFSNIAASVLRKCVVAEKQESVMKNVGKTCRIILWKDGQPFKINRSVSIIKWQGGQPLTK